MMMSAAPPRARAAWCEVETIRPGRVTGPTARGSNSADSTSARPAAAATDQLGRVHLPESPGDDEHDLLPDVDGVVADPLETSSDENHEHRPLAHVEIFADFDRALEDRSIEPVDLGVLAGEAARHLNVSQAEHVPGLDDLGAGEQPHLLDGIEDLLVLGGLVARERHERGDVHTLVPHPLHAADDVQQRGDQPQLLGAGRRASEQLERPLVDLAVAAIEAVVVGDDDLRELDVLVVERLLSAVELRDDEVEASEDLGLEALQILAEAMQRLRHSPDTMRCR